MSLYARIEPQMLLLEMRKTRECIARLELFLSDYYNQDPRRPDRKHPLEAEYDRYRDRLRELERILALVPMKDLAPFPTVIHPTYGSSPIEFLPIGGIDLNPTFDLKVDKDGNVSTVDGLAHLTASVMAALGKDANDAIGDMYISNATPPPRPLEDNPATIYESLKELAKKLGLPVFMGRQKKKDDGKGKDMTLDIQHLAPLGFKVLQLSPKLFYRIEKDGAVAITGEQQKCIINQKLPDGSLLAGGITPSNIHGAVFGDRIYQEKGVEVKKPIRWMKPSDLGIPTTAPMGPPIQNMGPNIQNIPKTPSLNRPIQGTASDLPKLPEDKAAVIKMIKEGLISTEEAMRALGMTVDKSEKPTRDRFNMIFGSGKDRPPWIAGEDSPTADQYARLKASYQRVQQELIQTKDVLASTKKQNTTLVEKLKKAEEAFVEAKHQAQVELESIRNRAVRENCRRWQIEAVRTNGVTVEGADATIFELEDESDSFKYLVVATIPRSTPSRVQEQWMEDLQRGLDARFGVGVVQYVIAPEDVVISVLEVVPGIQDRDDEDDLFQF